MMMTRVADREIFHLGPATTLRRPGASPSGRLLLSSMRCREDDLAPIGAPMKAWCRSDVRVRPRTERRMGGAWIRLCLMQVPHSRHQFVCMAVGALGNSDEHETRRFTIVRPMTAKQQHAYTALISAM